MGIESDEVRGVPDQAEDISSWLEDAMETFSTIIVGAGQAGLATARELAERGSSCVVLERNDRVGDGWRQQYDSLTLYSPAGHDGLPGLPFPAPKRSFPGKDQVGDYLQQYAEHFELPVRLRVQVDKLASDGSGYLVRTSSGDLHADNVVIATGTHGRTPSIPEFADRLDPAILQLHSSEYRRPAQLAPGPALVVGAAHSGCDIALELAATRPTTLVGRDCGQLPLDWSSRRLHVMLPLLLFAWQHVLTRRTPIGRKMMPVVRHHGGPMLRVKREHLQQAGVRRNTGRVSGVRNGRPLLDDGTEVDVANVIWATGFHPQFDWIDLPILGADGYPKEYRGVTDFAGLYFCGLSFQFAFASMVLPGVGRDAAYIAKQIVSR